MKTILAAITFLLFITFQLNAQNVPNPSFEAWTPSGSEPPFDWQEPTNWKSNNATVEFTGASVVQSTDSYEGDFSARIITPNIFGQTVPGMLVNGFPTLDFATYTVNVETGGTPLSDITDVTNSLPSSLEGYYKFGSTTPGDSAYVEVLLTKYNDLADQIDTAYYGDFSLAPTDEYSYFTVELSELSADIEPDNIIVAIYTTNPNNPLPEGNLFVDQLGFLFTPTDISNSSELATNIEIFPNPVEKIIGVNSMGSHALKTIEVYNLFGQKVKGVTTYDKSSFVNVEDLEKGVYILRIYDEFQQLLKVERVVKI